MACRCEIVEDGVSFFYNDRSEGIEMKKWIVCVLLAMGLAGLFSACGNDEEEQTQSAPVSSSEELSAAPEKSADASAEDAGGGFLLGEQRGSAGGCGHCLLGDAEQKCFWCAGRRYAADGPDGGAGDGRRLF